MLINISHLSSDSYLIIRKFDSSEFEYSLVGKTEWLLAAYSHRCTQEQQRIIFRNSTYAQKASKLNRKI